ncbi:ATP-binding cassette domain-containing protein [Rhodobacteraceae bacterium NNCM2]|nr:ATP-binding cassette domain-containing protein [Coraliihabitans acroporae]
MSLLRLNDLSLPGGLTLDLEVQPGETVALVGQTGAVGEEIARMMMGRGPRLRGTAVFDGLDILAAGKRAKATIRAGVGVLRPVGEAPLNPRRSIWQAMEEPLKVLLPRLSASERRDEIVSCFTALEVDPRWLEARPGELSADEMQIVALARALVADPDLLVAADPFRGLEIEGRARLINRLLALKPAGRTAMLVIGADLASAVHIADRILVVMGGKVVEEGPAADIRVLPRHRYTRQLVNALPEIGGGAFVLHQV